ncbi:hypothetical protein X275_08195 [Marinitoga sp. 1197]|uniref:helix-turn-helix transcriptional regulator n=1 Tax=Marinitoga sp. 1197 TaxID=1428449 RepID=UPI00064160E2|nr:helix-turn-helix transcriptional regulator [Marinitoga sp. 1197]KLO21862.1 hypothetical protein X275_08195 [Marinitoga sp. 1197]
MKFYDLEAISIYFMRRYNLSFGQIANALDLHKNSIQHHLKQLEKFEDDLELPSFFFQNIDRSVQTYEEKVKSAQEIAAKYYEEKKYLIEKLKEDLKNKKSFDNDLKEKKESEVIEEMEIKKSAMPVILRQAVRESKATFYENFSDMEENVEEKKNTSQIIKKDDFIELLKPFSIAIFVGFIVAFMQKNSNNNYLNNAIDVPIIQENENIDPFAQFRRGL